MVNWELWFHSESPGGAEVQDEVPRLVRPLIPGILSEFVALKITEGTTERCVKTMHDGQLLLTQPLAQLA